MMNELTARLGQETGPSATERVVRPKIVLHAAAGGLAAKGGIGAMLRYLVRDWRSEAADPVVIDTGADGPKLLMPLRFALALMRACWLMAGGRVVILHLHVAAYGSVLRKGLLARMSRRFGIPVILHVHAADFVEFIDRLPPWGLRRLRDLFDDAAAIIVLGRYWRDVLVERLGVSPEHIAILPNAVQRPILTAPRPKSIVPRIVFLGVVSERKGVPDLLAAFARPELAGLGWEAVIIGNGRVAEMRGLAQRLGIAARLTFTGFLTEADWRPVLASADILVLPSRNEGLPMAVLEGMAYGLAVLTTPVGATTDAIAEAETGLLVPPRDPARLAQALARLITDPSLCQQLGAAARRRFEQDFELSGYAQRLNGIYTGLGLV